MTHFTLEVAEVFSICFGYCQYNMTSVLCNCKSEINNVCNAIEGHCLQAMIIMGHHANGSFDWLMSGHLSINPLREAISVLSVKYKRILFVHPVRHKLLGITVRQSFVNSDYLWRFLTVSHRSTQILMAESLLESCSKAKVKLTRIVGPTMCADKS